MPLPYPSMVDALLGRASRCDLAYRWLADGEQIACEWTFAELDRRARRIASLLIEKKLTGHRILLVYSPGPEFLEAFWGCLYAGAVAVPTSPPNLSIRSRVAHRFLGIMQDSKCSLGLTTGDLLGQLVWLLSRESVTGACPFIDTTLIPDRTADSVSLPVNTSSSLAMLQYTSGSTKTPRGVMLTHGNLMANHEAMRVKCAHDESSVMVTWLPPYHDMGLIAGLLQPTVVGFPVVQMAPNDFLRKPVRWLQAVSNFKGTTGGGPNFAYSHCVEHIMDSELSDLDLSSWKTAFNGSEVVRADTINSFAGKFEKSGFQRSAFFPCYGLAEATLLVSSTPAGSPPKTIPLLRSELAQGRAIASDKDIDRSSVQHAISCGTPPTSHSLRIIDSQTGNECSDIQVGEIHVSGPSISPGYWGQTDSEHETFLQDETGQRWLATGDLGCIVNGALVITGRLKELIIIRGRNVIPQDLETTAGNAHRSLEPNAVAAFSTEVNGHESVVVAAELRRTDRKTANPQEIANTISQAISSEHDVALHEVVLLRPGSIPRTTSGKIQRLLCQQLYLANDWKVISRVICSMATNSDKTDCFSHSDRVSLQAFLLGSDRSVLSSIASPQISSNELPAAEYSQVLKKYVSRIAGRDGSEIRTDDSLSANGLDSLQRVELVIQFEAELGLPSGSLAVDECTTIDSLAIEIDEIRKNAVPCTSVEKVSTASQGTPPFPAQSGNHIPLTASQARFLNSDFNSPGCFPIIVYARLPVGTEEGQLNTALTHLAASQDVFRMQFRHNVNGWLQFDTGNASDAIPLESIDATTLSVKELRRTTQSVIRRIRAGFDISNGPLACATVFWHSPQKPATLVLGMHHLLTDAVSVSVCAAELSRQLTPSNLADSKQLQLHNPFGDYTRHVQTQLDETDWTSEIAYWTDQIGPPTAKKKTGASSRYTHVAERGVTTGRLSEELSRTLLEQFPIAREQHDLLAAALTNAWVSFSEQPDAVVELENHGRSSDISDGNLHGIAGWFSSRFPVRLRPPKTSPNQAFQHTLDVLSRVPNSGLNYGFLKSGTAGHEHRTALEQLRTPELAFFSRDTISGIGRSNLPVRILNVDVWHDYGFLGPPLTMYGGADGNLIRWDLQYVESSFSRQSVLRISEMVEHFLAVSAKQRRVSK